MGRGWMVVLASFMANLVVDGISYSFGIFLGEFQDYYHSSHGVAAMVGSLLTGCYLIVGPVVGGMVNRYGARAVMMMGSFIGMSAFFVSIWAPNMTILMMSYGIVGGVGFGLIYLPSIVHVGYYFERRRALATGIAVAGSGVGTFIFAPLSVHLIEAFGWKGCLWILAGIVLNCAVFGALLRPLKPKKRWHSEEMMVANGNDHNDRDNWNRNWVRSTSGAVSSRETVNPPQYWTEIGAVEKVLAWRVAESTDSANGDLLVENVENFKGHRAGTRERLAVSECVSNQTSPANPETARLSSKPHFYQTSVPATLDRPNPNQGQTRHSLHALQPRNLLRPRHSHTGQLTGHAGHFASRSSDVHFTGSFGLGLADADIQQYRTRSALSIPAEAEEDYEDEIVNNRLIDRYFFYAANCKSEDGAYYAYGGESCVWMPESVRHFLFEVIDIGLMREPAMCLLCVSNIFGMLGFYCPFVYLNNRAEQYGIHPREAAFLLSVMGIANTLGRVAFGWLSDRGWFSALAINNACVLFCAILTLLCPFFTTYAAMLVYATLFGFVISAYISLTSIVLVDHLGLDRLSNSFGLVVLFRGLAAIAGSPFAGMVYDKTRSYDASFYYAGGMLLTSVLVSSLVPLARRAESFKDCLPRLRFMGMRKNEPVTDTVREKDGQRVTEV